MSTSRKKRKREQRASSADKFTNRFNRIIVAIETDSSSAPRLESSHEETDSVFQRNISYERPIFFADFSWKMASGKSDGWKNGEKGDKL